MRRVLLSCLCLVFVGSPAFGDDPVSDADEQQARQWHELALTTESEEGFRRLITLAQQGGFGAGVVNANVGILKNHARVELVTGDGMTRIVNVTPKSSAGADGFFDVTAGERATAEDVQNVARALDAAFGDDPYRVVYDYFNVMPDDRPIPAVFESWQRGGWRGVGRNIERRMIGLAGLNYTIAIIALLALATLASLAVLWGSSPRI